MGHLLQHWAWGLTGSLWERASSGQQDEGHQPCHVHRLHGQSLCDMCLCLEPPVPRGHGFSGPAGADSHVRIVWLDYCLGHDSRL